MKRFWYFIFALLLIGILASVFSKDIISNTGLSNVQQKLTNTTSDQKSAGDLIFAVSDTNKFQILKLKPDNTSNIIFTDIDEKYKIKKLANQSIDSVISAFSDSNRLFKIKLNDQGRMVELTDKIQSSTDFALSPDESQVAYISFSNAERDYGYTIYLAKIIDTKPVELVRNSQLIENVIWLDKTNLMFIQDNSNLVIYNIVTNKSNIIYTTGNQDVIFDFSLNSDKIILSQGSAEKVSSSILTINLNGKNIKKIYTENKGIIYSPVLSPDGLNAAYLLSDSYSRKQNGYMYKIGSNGKNKQKLILADKIISWVL